MCNTIKEKIINKYGNKFDYSKLEYNGMKKKIKIICIKHGEFDIFPEHFLKSTNIYGCKLCKLDIDIINNGINFINKSIIIHNNKFDYSNVNYIKNNIKIKIICKTHGEFLQCPQDHLKGNGCLKCNIKNIGTFTCNANEIYNFKYDYTNTIYLHSKSKMKIRCLIHGEFETTASQHLSGSECSKCILDNNNNIKLNEFIVNSKKIYDDKYDYSKATYENSIYVPIILICKIHGEFKQQITSHLKGIDGCELCVCKRKTDSFIEQSIKIHGEKYNYDVCVYTKSNKLCKIGCKIHGIFEQTPRSHLDKNGCQKCKNKTEGILFDKLTLKYDDIIFQYKPQWCMGNKKRILSFDFYLFEHNIIIELDGEQHFKQVKNWTTPEYQLNNDCYKMTRALNNGCSIIRILQNDVFRNKYNWFDELINNIKLIVNSKNKQIIYMCKKNEYDNMQLKMNNQ